MNTLQEIAQFLKAGFPVSMRSLSKQVFNPDQPVSMREFIHRLENLPDINLQATVSPMEGEVPFTVTLGHTTSGLLLSYKWQVFQGSVLIAELPNDQPYKLETPAYYEFKVIQTGFNSEGYTEVSQSFSVAARVKPTPPPQQKLTISVSSNGDGSFVVSGSGFLSNSTINIRVVDAALTNVWFNQTSNSQGSFSLPTGKICQRAGNLYFSANDGRSDSKDLTGTLWSNTVTTSCPF